VTEFYAHSADGETRPTERWQRLAAHLRGVGKLARQFAAAARPGDENFANAAAFAGYLHDLGKYRREFQLLLQDRHPKNELTRHKQAGAAVAADQRRVDVAFAIAGHHGGLPDRDALKDLIAGPSGRALAKSIWSTAAADFPELDLPADLWPYGNDPLVLDIHTRLLFSCLVDADWQDTSMHERRARGLDREAPPPPLAPESCLRSVLAYIEGRAEQCPSRPIAEIRREILSACLQSAELPSGLFSMTVPTGGGKTLSGLAFALKHAHTHGLRRIIYAAPYLSIIEQNAREFRRALGADENSPVVFEHHSLADTRSQGEDEPGAGGAVRLAENWEAPVIVTTNVQFFESLFSGEPGRCRKLHNIARSVVILDECQTLPPDVVSPTCSMLGQIAQALSCTIVLCTATQPAWNKRDDFSDGLEEVRELIPARLDLFSRLRRVRVDWPKERQVIDWPDVAEKMLSSPASLCIVNTRKAARSVFARLRLCGCRDALHLSTSMCPAHRLQAIDEVRCRLKAGEACRLVSTQLIECGCDVDFPLVLREMAPLEAVIQSAGRCNREGLLNASDGSPGGLTVVFRTLDGRLPPDRWYRAGRDILEQNFLGLEREPDLGNPDDISDYFLRLYRAGELDGRGIQDLRRQSRFADVSREYQIIDAETFPVVVTTWQAESRTIDALVQEFRRNPSKRLRRRLGPYEVNLRKYELDQTAGCWIEESQGIRLWTGSYDDHFGIDSRNCSPLSVV
jgi:CRISPR-associated endonuclease/helicase Cas3